ncbi:MAG: glycosyltransferase [Clostridia bacterium]|nr:glycosyltransferase [Clostridia bacterium]
MRYAFLTTLIPPQLDTQVRYLSKNNMQDAANALEWHIYNGLCRNLNEEIKIFNILPIGSFPQNYRKPFVKKSLFGTNTAKDNVNIGFCNIKLLRKYRQPIKIYRELDKWCSSNSCEKTLFVYTVCSPFMTAVSKLKKKHPDVRICAIIADLPDMSSLSSNKSIFQKIYEEHLANNSYSRLDCIDAFVLLTRQMADYMKITKPFCVIEGISTEVSYRESIADENSTKNILYTGTLHKRFGVLNLVNAFRMISRDNYRLIICGIGDSEDEIRKAALADSRIIFKGQLPRNEVLKLQQEATVLVNPRQNTEEFTKYSFPSKNLEYLSSGKPLVAYKLDGIPDEYDDYIFYVKDNSVESLRDKLIEVCDNTDGSVPEKAKKAYDFVQDQKNEIAQTKKIIELLSELNTNQGDLS